MFSAIFMISAVCYKIHNRTSQIIAEKYHCIPYENHLPTNKMVVDISVLIALNPENL